MKERRKVMLTRLEAVSCAEILKCQNLLIQSRDNAYIAVPHDGNKEFGIVFFPDFMGHELINAKLYVDALSTESR